MSGQTSAENIATLASELQEKGDLERSQLLLENGVEEFPQNGGLWHNLGIVRSLVGDFSGAIDAYTKAIALDYPSLVNRGYNYEQLGDEVSAEADYISALSTDPDDVDALVDLGTFYSGQGKYDDARRVLERAANLDEKANWQLSDAYIGLGWVDRAESALVRAIGAGELRAYLELAELTALSAPRADVDRYFEEAIKAGAVLARREYAVFLDEAGDRARALGVAREGIRSGDGSCYAPLAVMLEGEGDLEGALVNYRLAVEDGDSDLEPDVHRLEEGLRSRG